MGNYNNKISPLNNKQYIDSCIINNGDIHFDRISSTYSLLLLSLMMNEKSENDLEILTIRDLYNTTFKKKVLNNSLKIGDCYIFELYACYIYNRKRVTCLKCKNKLSHMAHIVIQNSKSILKDENRTISLVFGGRKS